MRRNDPFRLWALLRRRRRAAWRGAAQVSEDLSKGGLYRAGRPSRALVVILDGTNSSLAPGWETHARRVCQLLNGGRPKADLSVFYEPGLQWDRWRDVSDVIAGRGINRQIARAYGFVASRYRPGDRIYLFGYSRGAFAVRSLAGLIDRMGLPEAHCATQRLTEQAYRHYRTDPDSAAARAFRRQFAQAGVTIQMVGVWDTVKALGVRVPLVWRLFEDRHAFHSHQVSDVVAHGYHALALNETRHAFAPEMWACPPGFQGDVQQVWFAGTHGDVGGDLRGRLEATGLSNIPFVWMMEKAEALGLVLPVGWRGLFPTDPLAPSVGNMRGSGRFFVLRGARGVGRDTSERVHPSVLARGAVPKRWKGALPVPLLEA